MKIQIKIKHLIFFFSTFLLYPAMCRAQGTAFTYNGSLAVGGEPGNGIYDMRFSLFTSVTGGVAAAGPITDSGILVSNGLFATTIDFGVGVFNGTPYWLDISVSPTGSNTFTELTPRQAITPVPYSIYSENAGSAATASSAAIAGTADSVSAANITGTLQLTQLPASLVNNGESGVTLSGAFSGDGSGLTNLSGANLAVGSVGAGQLANGTLAAPVDVAGNINATVDTSYVTTNVSPTDIFLPANAGSGDVVQITGAGSGAWTALAYSSNWLPTPAPLQTWSSLASSADGTHLVAASRYFDPRAPNPLSSIVFTSTNSGVSWTVVGGSLSWWTSLASSADGTHLIAAANNNSPVGMYADIYTSSNSGASWTEGSPDGVFSWGPVASSADGTHFVAMAYGYSIFASTNSGMNWTVEYPASAGVNLSSMALSSDGNFLAVAGSPGGIYTSTNFGATWSQTSAPSNDWSSLASSSDGSLLVAVAYPGGIYTSTNSGLNWTEQTSAPTNATWISVASSSDGTRLVASTGNIYTSTNSGMNWTEQTSAPASYVVSSSDGTHLFAISGEQILVSGGYGIVASGVQGGTTSLQYLGNGQWSPESLSQMNFSGTFSGDGSSLTNLNAAQLTSFGNTNGGFNNFFIGSAGNLVNSGSENTAIGYQALASNTSGSQNTANGYNALCRNTTGSGNTADGGNALEDLGYSGGGGTDNVAVGFLAGSAFYSNESSNIDIGNIGVAGENNIIRIGSSQSQAYIAGVINGNGGGLTNLNAAQFTSGTIPLSQLPPAVVTNNETANVTLDNLTLSGTLNLPATPITINSGSALLLRADGAQNFFAGPDAGNLTISGAQNTASGSGALSSDTTGDGNTAFGAGALSLNQSGDGNAAVGYRALASNTNGGQNTADGTYALFFNSGGNNNTADGYSALGQLGEYASSGTNNIALGYNAGDALISDESYNIDIGNPGVAGENGTIRIGTPGIQSATYIAGVINGDGGGLTNLNISSYLVNGSQLISVGNTNGGSGNFFVGPAGNSIMSGSDNTANGYQALASNTTGNANTAAGYLALEANTTGVGNTANGRWALSGNTSGNWNTANGLDALQSNTTGSDNTADGAEALDDNMTGGGNTANGYFALVLNTSGSDNTANGIDALFYNGIGNDNTADGAEALYNLGNAFFLSGGGTNNIALGYQAGYNFAGNESFNIDIGNKGVAGESGIIRIGDTNFQTACYLAGNVYASGNFAANSVNVTSDRNAKEDFATVNPQGVLAKVASLPITEWNYKSDKAAAHIGPMAQDFQAAFGLNGADDRHISVGDEGGVALAAIQGLNQKLEQQAAQMKEKDAEIVQLEARLDKLEQLVNRK